MKVTFLGATHEVTGSCTLIETNGKNILIDCGMEQGSDIFVNQEIPVVAADIDCVLLTHAHIDHSGNIPLLYKNGFRGKVYSTEATYNLCQVMLVDSAHIQEFEAKWQNRKAKRSGGEEYMPIYDINDAQGCLQQFYPCRYDKIIPILENVEIRFNDMGHLLGSASIEIWITENAQSRKIVFSGDIGNKNQPIIKDPVKVKEADYVVMESTYGDRLHSEGADGPQYIPTLVNYIQTTLDRGGNVIIPSFAVGRTQEILYFLSQIKNQGLVKGHGDFPVYVDSPLANEATSIFLQCDTDYFDDETKKIIEKGINPLVFPGLEISVTSDESIAINFDAKPKVIISSSGMCEAGRIRHHLKHNLWRKECLILFVGYQANGTLGRIIYDGAQSVKLFGEDVMVNAQIAYLPGISGHADKNGLIDWINGFEKKPKKVFINHGEDETCINFAKCLADEYGYDTFAPFSGTSFDLLSGEFVTETVGIRVERKKNKKTNRAAAVFNRLIAAANRLLAVAKRCEGRPNKDLAKFADQIDQLTNKWSD